jgi:hypothetical protein
MKEKEENETRWKTKTGFDIFGKKNSFNEHPKKPHESMVEDLKEPYYK